MEILWKDFQQAVDSVVFCANYCILAWFYGHMYRGRDSIERDYRYTNYIHWKEERNKSQGKQTWLSDNGVFGFNLIMTLLVSLN